MTILLQGAGLQETVVTPPDPIGDALRAAAVAYWKFDEASGTRLDASGHGVNLEEYLVVESVAGKIGNAVKVTDNTNDAQELDWSGNSISLSNGVSVFGWTRFAQFVVADGGYGHILNANDSGGTGNSFEVSIGPPEKPAVSMGIEAANGAVKSGALSIDTWHFFAYWHFDQIAYLQVDSGVTNSALILFAPPSFNRLGVAQTGYANNTDTFSIDEIGMLNRVITADEITYLYNSGAGRALFPAP